MIDTLIKNEDYVGFCQLLESKCGIVLGDNKQYLVKSRLTPLLDKYKLSSISELFNIVLSNRNQDLMIAAIDAMTTNETLWFRDSYPFDVLEQKVFPELLKEKNSINIWSSACSSGQEPYSIAILIDELKSKNSLLTNNFNILATDISSTMLALCQSGIYDEIALTRGLSPERQSRYFDTYSESSKQIKDNIKNMVTFKPQNLLESYAPLGKFDVIFCRNVLIYFSSEIKNKVLNQMADSLHSGGYLILGASESVAFLNEKFEMIRCNPGIIYRRK